MKKTHTLKNILNKVKSKTGYNILDNSKAPDTTFQFGGCRILADAFSKHFNRPLYVVYNKKENRIEHFVVSIIRDVFLDSDGIQSEEQIIKKIKEDGFYSDGVLEILPFENEMDTGTIIQDLEASEKLIELLKK
jgi:hypothetical protein